MPGPVERTLALCRHALLPCIAGPLFACGGGGGGGDASNRVPVLAVPNSNQSATQWHSFRYDPTQGGRTFSDADGDALTYDIALGYTYDIHSTATPPPGVRVEGKLIVGAPESLDTIMVRITASDPDGWTASDEFAISVAPNGAPGVDSPNDDVLVEVGGFVDVDAAKRSTALSDPEGDALRYEMSLRGEPRGLAVAGTRVTGVFDSIGLVEVTITARDAYGGVGSDVFLIAAPAPEPGSPTLPDTPYVYHDEGLELPYIFRTSSESVLPLWDTQLPENRTTDAGAALGRVLFHDKRLSITNTVACSTCHQQAHGFATPERFGFGALGVPTKRSPMALANVRYNIQHAWFSDMRVEFLEQLVLEPIQNPEELGISLELLESKLQATPFYPPLFEAAFGTSEIRREQIAQALTQFLQAMLAYRSKFDRAFNSMDNEPMDPSLVLNAQEMRGLEIYTDEGRGFCDVCHELSNGANEWHANNGLDEVPADPGTLNPALQRDGSLGVFRAASVRNIAVTGPYMHDGRFATLRDVIEHYDHGVKDSPDLDFMLVDPHGSPRRMNLSEEDKDALEAFLRTFTDEEFLADPKFSDPFE